MDMVIDFCKKRHILDLDDNELLKKVVLALEEVTLLSKRKNKK